MLKEVDKFVKDFLEVSKDKPVRIISHYDTDGITSAAILAKALKRLDKKFSVKIVKGLEEDIIKKELERQPKEVLLFSDLASGSLDYFKDAKERVFILDHHELDKEKVNEKTRILNPHLHDLEKDNCTGAGVCYFFARTLSEKNSDLSYLAIIGMIGDRHEKDISKACQQIIEDTNDLEIRKGLLIYPATRPLRRALEWSTSPYLPGITGEGVGVQNLLREISVDPNKSLLELNEEEMSKLITAIMVRRKDYKGQDEVIGNLYILKFFNTKEDVRELSVLINACSRLGYHDTALALCLENEAAKRRAQDIYNEYKQELVSGLKVAENIDKIEGEGYIILNAQSQIKDAIIGTVCSMISSSAKYPNGTVLIGMAYNGDKIKISARINGRDGRNLKEALEKTVNSFKKKHPETTAEVGGHHYAAGCLIEKEKEKEFIEILKETLEIEVVKV